MREGREKSARASEVLLLCTRRMGQSKSIIADLLDLGKGLSAQCGRPGWMETLMPTKEAGRMRSASVHSPSCYREEHPAHLSASRMPLDQTRWLVEERGVQAAQ